MPRVYACACCNNNQPRKFKSFQPRRVPDTIELERQGMTILHQEAHEICDPCNVKFRSSKRAKLHKESEQAIADSLPSTRISRRQKSAAATARTPTVFPHAAVERLTTDLGPLADELILAAREVHVHEDDMVVHCRDCILPVHLALVAALHSVPVETTIVGAGTPHLPCATWQPQPLPNKAGDVELSEGVSSVPASSRITPCLHACMHAKQPTCTYSHTPLLARPPQLGLTVTARTTLASCDVPVSWVEAGSSTTSMNNSTPMLRRANTVSTLYLVAGTRANGCPLTEFWIYATLRQSARRLDPKTCMNYGAVRGPFCVTSISPPACGSSSCASPWGSNLSDVCSRYVHHSFRLTGCVDNGVWLRACAPHVTWSLAN